MIRRKDIYLVINATDRCNRGCSHCMFDSMPSGNSFFTPEMAQTIIDEIEKFDEKTKIRLCITGGGEPLMNPNLVKIFDVFFASKKIRHAILLTSGFLPKDKEEEVLLEQLAKKSYAGRINFTLSFNGFNVTLPERLKNSLMLICKQKKPRYISINLALSDETAHTAHEKIKEIFYDVSENIGKSDPFGWIGLRSLDYRDGFLLDIVKTNILTKKIYGEETLQNVLSASSLCSVYYGFYSKLYKSKNIMIAPFIIRRLGRAKKLISGIGNHNFCSFIFQNEERTNLIKLSIDSAGNFYPYCCKNRENLRIGKLGTNSLKEIFERQDFLKENILRNLMADSKLYPDNDVCGPCQRVVAEKLS